MNRLRFAFALAAIALLAGCASMGSHKKDEARDATLADYAAALRWGDFASAYQFVDPEVRKQHPLDAAAKREYKAVQVGDYQAQPPIASGENTIRQVVQISLIRKNSQTSYDIIDRQSWRYDPATGRWWLESGLPNVTPPAAD